MINNRKRLPVRIGKREGIEKRNGEIKQSYLKK